MTPSSKTLADFCKRSGSSLFSGNHDDVAFLLELFLELSSGQLCPWRLWSSMSSMNPAGSGCLGRDSPSTWCPTLPPWPQGPARLQAFLHLTSGPAALGRWVPAARGREAFPSGWRSGDNGFPLNGAGDAAFDILPFTIITVDFLRF